MQQSTCASISCGRMTENEKTAARVKGKEIQIESEQTKEYEKERTI